MSFDYDQIKNREEGGSHWATYSDLFMVLSLIFLLLYVVASLRTGASSLNSQAEYQAIERERDDLKQQIKVYNTLKNNYLKTGASQDEQQLYGELMDKLTLLKEEAKDEKEKLRKAASENEKKELALNKYQQMVRNIINTNMISNVRIKRRDVTIEEKGQEITKQKSEIKSLEKVVAKKQSQIKSGQNQIKKLNKTLDSKVASLKRAYKKNKISKKKMRAKIAALQKKNKTKVRQLEQKNLLAAQEIEKKKQAIQQVSKSLEDATRTIASQEKSIMELSEEKQEAIQKISQVRQDFQEKMKRESLEFQKKLKKQKMSASARAKKQQEFLAKAKSKEQAMAAKLENMESEVQQTQEQLEQTKKAQQAASEAARNLASQNRNLANKQQKLSSDLKKMKELANAKKRLIGDLKKNLVKAGLKAEVDPKSGDVMIQFGEEYFDTGKAQLKPGMEQVLKKLMPAYSETLFNDDKVAKKIKSVEIIGFASPTYKGKYVNPVSLSAGNKEAVNYNMDLSYYRARSIFDYIFDTKKMKYSNQRKLLPMVKVTGRSFLASGKEKRALSSMSNKEYCKKFDCKKSQRVVIKFNMDN